MSAKAGLEHRNYPYDLKRLKFTKEGMIPSLIPSDPIDTYRFDYNQLAAFMLMKSIYILNKKRRLFVKKAIYKHSVYNY